MANEGVFKDDLSYNQTQWGEGARWTSIKIRLVGWISQMFISGGCRLPGALAKSELDFPFSSDKRSDCSIPGLLAERYQMILLSQR